MFGLTRLVIYLCRVAWNAVAAMRSRNWLRTEATVTANAERVGGHAGFSVEFPYTYRFEGELYTGLHQEPSFGGLGSEYMDRFILDRRIIVRVNPKAPEVSVVREVDQTDSLFTRLEQIDGVRNRPMTQK